MFKILPLMGVVSLLASTSALHALPSWGLPPQLQLVAKKEPKKIEVLVSEAKLASENIVGSWYHTLSGKVANQSEGSVQNVRVHYEIYAADTDTIIDAGSVLAQPEIIPGGGEGEFSIAPNKGGRVRVTLVEWQKADRKPGYYNQRQFFPLTGQVAGSRTNAGDGTVTDR